MATLISSNTTEGQATYLLDDGARVLVGVGCCSDQLTGSALNHYKVVRVQAWVVDDLGELVPDGSGCPISLPPEMHSYLLDENPIGINYGGLVAATLAKMETFLAQRQAWLSMLSTPVFNVNDGVHTCSTMVLEQSNYLSELRFQINTCQVDEQGAPIESGPSPITSAEVFPLGRLSEGSLLTGNFSLPALLEVQAKAMANLANRYEEWSALPLFKDERILPEEPTLEL